MLTFWPVVNLWRVYTPDWRTSVLPSWTLTSEYVPGTSVSGLLPEFTVTSLPPFEAKGPPQRASVVSKLGSMIGRSGPLSIVYLVPRTVGPPMSAFVTGGGGQPIPC